MKPLFWTVLIILGLHTGYAQNNLEQYPQFKNCTASSATECFYNELYKQLRLHYKHPLKEEIDAIIRIEIDRTGKIIPIQIESLSLPIKNAIKTAFNKINDLDILKPGTYNGRNTYMQFVLSAKLPLKESGSFVQPQSHRSIDKAQQPVDYAIKNNDYTQLISNNYKNQEINSEALVPFSYQRYAQFEAAMNLIGNNAHTAVKPYSFNDVHRYYDLEAEQRQLFKPGKNWLHKKWWNENFFQLADKDYWLTINPGVDLQLGRDTRNNTNTFNNTRLIMVNGGIGKQLTLGATIQESQGRFAPYFNKEIENRAPDGGNPGIVPGRGIAEDGGDLIYDYPVATGYINYKPSKYFGIQLGHGQHFIGDGYRSLVLSDNSQPFPYAKVHARFWKFDYTVLYTSLRDVRPEVTADDSFRTKYMVHHYLSWNATKRLNLGFFESVLWQNDNQRGFDFNYINPIIFYQTIELQTGSRGGNALLGATVKYKVSDRITTYAQLVLDEFALASVRSGNGSYQNKSGYQLGVKWQNAMGIKGLMLQAEYNRVRPFTYSHNTVVLNYGNSNQALAHPWGANFYEAMVIARYNRKRWYGNFQFHLGQRGYDILSDTDMAFYGGNIYRSEDDRISDNNNSLAQGNTVQFSYGKLEAGYIINPSSRLSIYAQLIYRDFSPAQINESLQKQQTTWINFGLRNDIMNWSFAR